MNLSKNSQGFIYMLLLKELEAEYIQDNDNIEEVEYVQELIKASREFGKNMGFPYDYILEDAIKKLKGE